MSLHNCNADMGLCADYRQLVWVVGAVFVLHGVIAWALFSIKTPPMPPITQAGITIQLVSASEPAPSVKQTVMPLAKPTVKPIQPVTTPQTQKATLPTLSPKPSKPTPPKVVVRSNADVPIISTKPISSEPAPTVDSTPKQTQTTTANVSPTPENPNLTNPNLAITNQQTADPNHAQSPQVFAQQTASHAANHTSHTNSPTNNHASHEHSHQDNAALMLSGGNLNASWEIKPDVHFDALERDDYRPKTQTISVRFSFDKRGSISNVRVSSGDRALDRAIRQRVARARLKEQPRAGEAQFELKW